MHYVSIRPLSASWNEELMEKQWRLDSAEQVCYSLHSLTFEVKR